MNNLHQHLQQHLSRFDAADPLRLRIVLPLSSDQRHAIQNLQLVFVVELLSRGRLVEREYTY